MKNSNKSYTPYGVSKKAMEKIWDGLEPIYECDYCGGDVTAVNNYVIYHGYNFGEYPWIYYCPNCKASIGIYDNTNIPKGTLANNETKEARSSVFEHLKIVGRAIGTEDNKEIYNELLKVCEINLNETWVNVLSKKDCDEVIWGCIEIASGIQSMRDFEKFKKTPTYLEDKKKWEQNETLNN
jgi:hypothetical protein